MSDVVIAAIITVGGMVIVIVFNEIALAFRNRVNREKEFFNNFFPERLNAHKEIMRVIAETKILYIDPDIVAVSLIKEVLVNARQSLEAALLNTALFAAPKVKQGLFAFTKCLGKVIEAHEGNGEVLDKRRVAISALQRDHDDLVKLVFRYSGVHIIDQEFGKLLKRPKNTARTGKAKDGGGVSGQENHPKKGV
jgi:hypothetical protein